jgi:hypothetical protein
MTMLMLFDLTWSTLVDMIGIYHLVYGIEGHTQWAAYFDYHYLVDLVTLNTPPRVRMFWTNQAVLWALGSLPLALVKIPGEPLLSRRAASLSLRAHRPSSLQGWGCSSCGCARRATTRRATCGW